MNEDKDKNSVQMGEIYKSINGPLLNYNFLTVGDFPVFPPLFNEGETEGDDENDKKNGTVRKRI